MLVAALLAGGRSARMGRPKSTVVVEGRTMADRALDALRGLAAPIVVVGHGDGVDEALPRIADARAGVGPLGGLEALLASGRGDAYVVLPVDMPWATTKTLRALVDARGDATACAYRGQPFPLVVHARALPVLRARLDAGDRRVVAFVDALDPVRLDPPATRALDDVDTPGDVP